MKNNKKIISFLFVLFFSFIGFSQNIEPVASNVSAATVKNTDASIHLVASDVDFDSLTYSIVSEPSKGTAVLDGDIVTYTPAADYAGNDTFTFKANDGSSDSETQTVTIKVIKEYLSIATQIGNDIDGVDLNRNFSFNWAFGDTFLEPDNSDYASHYDYYKGEEPFSETEAIALRDLALENDFVFSIVWHSSRSGNLSEKVFTSWKWEDVKESPDLDIMKSIADHFSGLIPTEDGTKEDIERLRFWIERGKAWSMNMLADSYDGGIGVPQNDKRAFELYTMAAEQDHVTAINNLGFMYYNGIGTEPDYTKGKELWIRAAALGSIEAIISLKMMDKHEGNTTSSFTPTRTSCSFCGVAHAPPKVKLNPCSGCHSVFYCSKEHQIMDWKLSKYGGNGHKEKCKLLQDASK